MVTHEVDTSLTAIVLDLGIFAVAAVLWQEVSVVLPLGFHIAGGQWVFVDWRLAHKYSEDSGNHGSKMQERLHKNGLHFLDSQMKLLRGPVQQFVVAPDANASSMKMSREGHCMIRLVVACIDDRMKDHLVQMNLFVQGSVAFPSVRGALVVPSLSGLSVPFLFLVASRPRALPSLGKCEYLLYRYTQQAFHMEHLIGQAQ